MLQRQVSELITKNQQCIKTNDELSENQINQIEKLKAENQKLDKD
jgi:hypothetical protein